MTENGDKNHYDLFVLEAILAPTRRTKLRILICFNSREMVCLELHHFAMIKKIKLL